MTKLTLESHVNQLKGVGKQTAKRAYQLGIKNIRDLLTYFPFRYNDYKSTDLENEPDKAKVTLVGRVNSIPNRKYHGKLNQESFQLSYDHDRKSVHVMFFNMAWLVYKVHRNDDVMVYGQVHIWKNYKGQKEIGVKGNKVKVLNSFIDIDDIVKPIYPSSQHIHQSTIQRLVKKGWKQGHNLIKEVVPRTIRNKYRLENEATVIHDLHFPKSTHDEYLARRTEKFTEFYQYELKLAQLKANHKKRRGIAIHYNKKLLRNFDDNLPFKMTSGQIRSVYEIVTNLSDKTQMNRLLQGDVGSGKTVVAAFGILATISAGYQAAIMIPTSVLGEQHYKTFRKLFNSYDINILLLTGDMKPAEQTEVKQKIADGTAQLVIGTESLIQPDVKFRKLGMAVIDEQHKFGVDQRKALINKGNGVNTLSMTATPIPRTLAITSYGDMDISIIDTLPKGRKPVITKWIRPIKFSQYVSFFKSLLAKGQQAYCVVPLVKHQDDDTKANGQKDYRDQQTNYHDQHDNEDKLDAITAYKHFKKIFAPYKVGVLYGPMPDDEKDKVLQDFKAGKIQFLVSTTVVEVGVDAPKATMMIIWNAENAGLASLHQLRGRVGRNSLQSYCLLVSSPKTPEGRKRMRVMEQTNNGFVVSEADLKLRGSGDVFGSSQSGLPQFKMASPIDDTNILVCARNEALIQVNKMNSIKTKK